MVPFFAHPIYAPFYHRFYHRFYLFILLLCGCHNRPHCGSCPFVCLAACPAQASNL